jgi:hypothetical protein
MKKRILALAITTVPFSLATSSFGLERSPSFASEESSLKIQPTRDQWNRFIIQHSDWYSAGSTSRNEEFARQLVRMEKELVETGSVTLTQESNMVDHWQALVENDFVLDE